MNGKKAKILRGRFGHKTRAYRRAKKAYATYPTLFAQGVLKVPERAPHGEGLGRPA